MSAKKPPLCILTWLDAHSPGATEVVNISDVDKVHHPLHIQTIGWVLKDNHDGITIASEDCGDGDYRGVTFVLRSLVVKLESVKQPKTKKAPPLGGAFDEGLTSGTH